MGKERKSRITLTHYFLITYITVYIEVTCEGATCAEVDSIILQGDA